MGTLALILVPAALFAGVVAAVLALRDASGRPAGRPAAVFPVRWVAFSAMLLLLGLVVAPRLLGFTFVLLPFLLIAGAGRRRRER